MADNTFKNTSDQTFVDGDLVIRPGETVTDINDDRADQFRGMYSWQFEEASAGKDARTTSTQLLRSMTSHRWRCPLRMGTYASKNQAAKARNNGRRKTRCPKRRDRPGFNTARR
jgi:hypothetical protein